MALKELAAPLENPLRLFLKDATNDVFLGPQKQSTKTMYTVIEERIFHASHAIQYPNGTWEEPHAHDWILRVHVRAQTLDHVHLVIDFLVLQAMINEVLAPFEGHCINDVPPFSEGTSPSTEFLARLFFEGLAAKINDERVWLHKIELREAPTSWAVFQVDRPTQLPHFEDGA